VPSSVLPDSNSSDVAAVFERVDREGRAVNQTSTDLVPDQQIRLPTHNVLESYTSPLPDIVADNNWGYEEPATPTEKERDFREQMSSVPSSQIALDWIQNSIHYLVSATSI